VEARSSKVKTKLETRNWMFKSLIHLGSIVGVFTQGIARLLPRSEVLTQELAVLVVEWLILLWMYKRRIFIKA
jgi:hypothetical protein